MYIIQLVSEQCTYVHKDSLSLRIHYSDSENLKTFIGGILPDQVGVTYLAGCTTYSVLAMAINV